MVVMSNLPMENGSGRLKNNLNVAVLTAIEFFERVRGVVERKAVADDLAGFGCAVYDHVTELAVPALVVVPTHRNANIVVEELGPGHLKVAFLERWLDAVWIFERPDPDDCHSPSRIN